MDSQVFVWSVADGTEVASYDDTAADALACSPDGTRLATAGSGPVTVLDVAFGEVVKSLGDSCPASAGLACIPDGRWLTGPGPDIDPAVWDTSDLTPVDQLDGARLDRLAFSPDSTALAVTDTEDDTVRLWTPPALQSEGGAVGGTRAADVRELVAHTDAPEAVVFSPDGTELYSVAGEDGVLAWDVASAQLLREFELPAR